MIVLTLEEQNGQSMIVGEFATLDDVTAKIQFLDEAWENQPFTGAASQADIRALGKWEGCELSVVIDGKTWMFVGGENSYADGWEALNWDHENPKNNVL